MAQLISRFLNVLGVERGKDETDLDFGTRVEDSLTLVQMIGKKEARSSHRFAPFPAAHRKSRSPVSASPSMTSMPF